MFVRHLNCQLGVNPLPDHESVGWVDYSVSILRCSSGIVGRRSRDDQGSAESHLDFAVLRCGTGQSPLKDVLVPLGLKLIDTDEDVVI